MDELIDIVNKKGKALGQAKRSVVYQTGALHLAVNIVIFNSQGKLLLQQRSRTKSVMPLFWDISASEHVKSKENTKDAAIRGLYEELGIKTRIDLIRPFHLQSTKYEKEGQLILENELVELYVGTYDGKYSFDKKEVSLCKFVAPISLSQLIYDENFTPWGKDEIKFLLKTPKFIEKLRYQI